MYRVTLSMVIINIVIFVIGKFTTISLLQYYLVPIYLTKDITKYMETLFTSMFIHIDYLHIIFNAITLFFLGRIIESYIGSTKFFFIYLISGIVGGILHTLYTFFTNHNLYTPVIGASGAISGIIGISAAFGDKLALFWLLVQIILALFSGIESIAFFAHIGGFITGFLIGRLWSISYKVYRL